MATARREGTISEIEALDRAATALGDPDIQARVDSLKESAMPQAGFLGWLSASIGAGATLREAEIRSVGDAIKAQTGTNPLDEQDRGGPLAPIEEQQNADAAPIEMTAANWIRNKLDGLPDPETMALIVAGVIALVAFVYFYRKGE